MQCSLTISIFMADETYRPLHLDSATSISFEWRSPMFYREQSYSYDFTIPADDYNLNVLGDVDLSEKLCWDELQYKTRIEGIPMPMSGILKVTGISDGRLSVQFAERNVFWEKAKEISLSAVAFSNTWPSEVDDIFPLLEETRYYHETLGKLPTGEIDGFVAVSLRLLIKGCIEKLGYSVDNESIDNVAFRAERWGRFVVSHFPNATLDSFRNGEYEGLGIKEVRFQCSTTIGSLLQDIATVCCGRFIVDNDTRLVRFVTFVAGYTSAHQHFGAIRFPVRYKLDMPAPLQAEGEQYPQDTFYVKAEDRLPAAAQLPDYIRAPITISATINNKSYIQTYGAYWYRLYPPYDGLSIFDPDAAAIVRDERKQNPKELRVPLLLQQSLGDFDQYRLNKYTSLGDTLYSVEGSDKYTWRLSGSLKEMTYSGPHNEVSHNFKRGTWVARARNTKPYRPNEVPITGYENSSYDINIDSSGYIPDDGAADNWSRDGYKNQQGDRRVNMQELKNNTVDESKQVTYGYAYIYAPAQDSFETLHSLAVATKSEQDMAELNTLYLRTDGDYSDGFAPKGKQFESERPPQPTPGTTPTPPPKPTPDPDPEPPVTKCTTFIDNGYGRCARCGKVRRAHPNEFIPAPGDQAGYGPSA